MTALKPCNYACLLVPASTFFWWKVTFEYHEQCCDSHSLRCDRAGWCVALTQRLNWGFRFHFRAFTPAWRVTDTDNVFPIKMSALAARKIFFPSLRGLASFATASDFLALRGIKQKPANKGNYRRGNCRSRSTMCSLLAYFCAVGFPAGPWVRILTGAKIPISYHPRVASSSSSCL